MSERGANGWRMVAASVAANLNLSGPASKQLQQRTGVRYELHQQQE
jgi:hypothetical protein